MSDTDADILAILDAKIEFHRAQYKEHKAAVEQHRADMERYEAAAKPLRSRNASAAAPQRRARSGGTSKLIERVLRESGHLTIAELTDQMLERGWETSSENPANNVRTQVGRMIEADMVTKTEDGRYILVQAK